jgi:hypothetical protein
MEVFVLTITSRETDESDGPSGNPLVRLVLYSSFDDAMSAAREYVDRELSGDEDPDKFELEFHKLINEARRHPFSLTATGSYCVVEVDIQRKPVVDFFVPQPEPRADVPTTAGTRTETWER